MVADLAKISKEIMEEIRGIESNEDLIRYWDEVIIKKLNDGLSSVISECGTSMVPLFTMRKQIAKVSDADMANRLCGGCVGVIDCMKPLLLLEDVVNGNMTREEYVDICGHRSVNEMELMSPRPYENPAFPDNLIEERKTLGVNLHEMQKIQQKKIRGSACGI